MHVVHTFGEVDYFQVHQVAGNAKIVAGLPGGVGDVAGARKIGSRFTGKR